MKAIGKEVQDYIRKNYLFSSDAVIGCDQSLLSTGVLDSTGILELIGYLETTYNLKFADNELVADNFDTVARIEALISRKLNGASEAVHARS